MFPVFLRNGILSFFCPKFHDFLKIKDTASLKELRFLARDTGLKINKYSENFGPEHAENFLVPRGEKKTQKPL